MKNIQKILITSLFLIILVISTKAQRINNTLYFMKGVPQSNYLNPALQPDCKYFIGVPLISSIYGNYSNTGFTYNDLIIKGADIKNDSHIINLHRLHDALGTTNFGSLETEISMLAFGMKYNDYYFTFDITNKSDVRGNFNKEVISFLKNGIENYKGKTSDWGEINFNAFEYNEIALGASKKIRDKWYIGGRLKILMGLANAHLKNSNLSATVSEIGDNVTIHSKQLLYSSLPMQIKYRYNGSVKTIRFPKDEYNIGFYTNTSNLGIAVDLGMSYQVNKRTKLYASILDLGSIAWKSNTVAFYQDVNLQWDKNSWKQSGNPNIPNYKDVEDVAKDIIDSLRQHTYGDTLLGNYSTTLPTKIYMGIGYEPNKNIRWGALFRTTIYRGKALPSVTFSFNSRLKEGINTSFSYTIANNSYSNLGIGMAIRRGMAQLYFVTDNILEVLDSKNIRLANLRFGVNILLGYRKENKLSNSCIINYKRNEYYRKIRNKRR